MVQLSHTELFEFLEKKYAEFNTSIFIESDPILIPHHFTRKEDIEISGFFAATLAWGQRPVILKKAAFLMQLMDNAPFNFIMNHEERDLHSLKKFIHRTFNGEDTLFFISSLKEIYQKHGGLEWVFSSNFRKEDTDTYNAITAFRKIFLNNKNSRSSKHISNPADNSSAKRINMFLRWMVRKDTSGVDFGLWNNINSSQLCCPLDVHSGRIGRMLGLLERKQNDWKAVIELTDNLKLFCPEDPVKYDFALFGLGVNEKF